MSYDGQAICASDEMHRIFWSKFVPRDISIAIPANIFIESLAVRLHISSFQKRLGNMWASYRTLSDFTHTIPGYVHTMLVQQLDHALPSPLTRITQYFQYSLKFG